jgi:hypothetical protein
MSEINDKRTAIFMEDQDADRRQPQQPVTPPPPQTPGEHEGGVPVEYIPGEEAGDAGKESRGA